MNNSHENEMFRHAINGIIRIAAVLILVILMASSAAFADEGNGALEVELRASGDETGVTLMSSDIDGTPYFFLPSGVTEENIYKSFEEGTVYETMQSANIASIHFFSTDPAKGMDYVHENKDNKAPGEVYMYDENFSLIYSGAVDALKGRGNTTWSQTEKRSYQIKLAKKADLLDPVNGSQKAKKWILLANPFDPTLIRNYMIYNFGKELGLENSPEGRPVDLYYDGEYRGSYYLCEKVEIGDGRVEIRDLEKEIENVNPDVDLDDMAEVSGTTYRGLEMKYEDGIVNPRDITGGYIVELDNVYYTTEKSWFEYNPKRYATVKSPEYTSKAVMDYISSSFGRMYDYVTDAKRGANDGSQLGKYIDLDSFARFFLVNEWFNNNDVWISSTFMYKPADEDRFYAGPLWDLDSSMRIRRLDRAYNAWFVNQGDQMLGELLFRTPAFRQKVKEVYQNDMRSVVFDILLGEGRGEYLEPASVMKEEMAASVAMNYMIWDINDCLGSYYPKATVEENYEDIMSWMKNRAEWVDKQIMSDDFVSGKVNVSRIYGNTRFETSLKVADELKAQLGVDKFDTVILAYGKNYADALAGSYLSCVTNAPILLVDQNADHIRGVQAYIKGNLAPEGKIYLLGGEAVVPESAISGLDGYEVKRLWGTDRYETNLAILEEASSYAGDETEILICSGTGFADSLSASAVGKPILLVKNGLQACQTEYLEGKTGLSFEIIGGTGAVNASVESDLGTYGTVERIGGSTRFETSVNVAKKFFLTPESCVLAYGMDFPDGLCGGALAHAMNGPLILTANNRTQAATAYVYRTDIKDVKVLGGPALISDASVKLIFVNVA